MQIVNIHEAKTKFSKWIDASQKGEEIIIVKAGLPIVKLVPISQAPARKLGLLKGKIKIAKDFDAALPEDILKSFGG